MSAQSGLNTIASNSSAPASIELSPAEVQLLGELYAVLLANIRQNRARRLAQSSPGSTTSGAENQEEICEITR